MDITQDSQVGIPSKDRWGKPKLVPDIRYRKKAAISDSLRFSGEGGIPPKGSLWENPKGPASNNKKKNSKEKGHQN
jgi:hypothetical protein